MKNKKKNQKRSTINSPEPNDGTFINRSPKDSFSAEGTVRYGEETDVDDI
ncbi:hypothetical protein [Clostridium sp. Ade.TY]|nr:hypothetical protein [Clostridium sp. Ade.TY]